MKFYRPLLQGLIESLSLTLEQHKVATHVLESVFKKHKKWGSKDRKALAEAFYEIIKWHLALKKQLLDHEPNLASKMDYIVVYYLASKGFLFEEFMGYPEEDLSWINKAQALAAKSPFVIADFMKAKVYSNWNEFEQYSFPEALHVRLKNQHFMLLNYYKNSQAEAPLFIRGNLHLTSVADLQTQLKQEGFHTQAHAYIPFGLEVAEKANLFKTKAFQQGLFEVQDGGSQQIAPFLEAAQSGFVIDACAGGGGKSLHLSNLMQNKGRILAMDIHNWKLDELKKRARRNQCHNIETRWIEGTKTIKRLKDKADRLLLDVPCSGSGVFRRNPDAKYKWSDQAFDEIHQLQKSILQNYSSMVKPGGVLVYSTCSVMASENQEQVQAFLQQNTEWTLDNERHIEVGENNFDGYYMARLCRKS